MCNSAIKHGCGAEIFVCEMCRLTREVGIKVAIAEDTEVGPSSFD